MQYAQQKFTFNAPWGEKMIVEFGDWLACPVETEKGEFDIYRIEKDTFNDTYDLPENINEDGSLKT